MNEQLPRFELDAYPSHAQSILRYNDMDRAAHVNNAVFSTFFEAGRVPILYDPSRRMPPEGCHFSLVRITIEYLSEVTWPGTVEIGTGVVRIGNSSVTFAQAVYFEGRISAVAQSTVVLTDSLARKSKALPDHARAMFEELLLPQGA